MVVEDSDPDFHDRFVPYERRTETRFPQRNQA